jgi:hypothetical protein
MNEQSTSLERLSCGLLIFAIAACGGSSGAGNGGGGGGVDPAAAACDLNLDSAAQLWQPQQVIEIGSPYCVIPAEDYPKRFPIEIDAPTSALLLVDGEDVLWGNIDYPGTDGRALELTSSGPNPFCEEQLPEHYHLEFPEAGQYSIAIAPHRQHSPVCLLLLPADGHDDEDSVLRLDLVGPAQRPNQQAASLVAIWLRRFVIDSRLLLLLLR